MLAIYDKIGDRGKQYFHLYDPKPHKDKHNKPILNNYHCIILRHILNTVTPGSSIKGFISLPRTKYNCQADADFSSCGVHVCHYAKEYANNRSIHSNTTFNIHLERNSICEFFNSIYNNRHQSLEVHTPQYVRHSSVTAALRTQSLCQYLNNQNIQSKLETDRKCKKIKLSTYTESMRSSHLEKNVYKFHHNELRRPSNNSLIATAITNSGCLQNEPRRPPNSDYNAKMKINLG